tara:strand:+ start:26900 stop:29305 length:2406 start_codon:yes stop_codon:yes gene_type:complete
MAAFAGLMVFLWVHPLPLPALVFVGAVIVACLLHRHAWLCLLPALLPVADRAAWTGQIFLTESDALVLAILLVLALRLTLRAARGVRTRSPRSGATGFSLGVGRLLLLSLLAVSYLVSTDWTAFSEIWSGVSRPAGYFSALNGPRLAKGFLFALLLLPFLWRALDRDGEGALRALLAGLLAGLMLVALATVWERWLFVGLSNFSADYRTTALFWEVNVGGAMLDAWLALTVPFLVWLALRVRRPLPAAAVLVALALAGYAVFTTFSRGLYLGLGVGLLGMFVLLAAQAWRGDRQVLLRPDLAVLLLAALGLAFLLPMVFATGGYRGLAAAAVATLLAWLVAPVASVQPYRGWLAAFLLLVPGVLISAAFTVLVPKGVYIVYSVSAVLALWLLFGPVPRRSYIDIAPLALGSVLWVAVNAALVTRYWSEGEGWLVGWLFAGLLLAVLLVLRWRPALCWQPDVAGGIRVLMGLGALMLLVLVTGTYYASERFSTVDRDLAGRESHWSLAASLPEGPGEHWLGIGTGKFAQSYFWKVDDDSIPGTHQLLMEDGNTLLRLGGPRHVLGFGELYRVTQSVNSLLEGPFTGHLRARAASGGRIHLEICRKHLLYAAGCATHKVALPASGAWTEFQFTFDQQRLGTRGLIPRPTRFSIANATRSRAVDIGSLELTDADGRELLRNTRFEEGADSWFFTSDRHHLPWHAKNLWLHYYVEQGWFGTLAFTAIYLLVLYRLVRGRAVRVAWSPPLTGALVAFGAVGMFDSLVDAPRITLLFFMLLAVASGLRPLRSGQSISNRTSPASSTA